MATRQQQAKKLTAEDIIYKLYEFFKVNNNLDLAELLKTTPQTISNWKTRNSISAIKKKCRELGIYNEILKDFDKEDFGIDFPNDIKKTLDITKTMIKDNQELKNQFHQYLKDFIKDNL